MTDESEEQMRIYEMIGKTNRTHLRSLLEQLGTDTVSEFCRTFKVSSVDELVSILLGNDTSPTSSASTVNHSAEVAVALMLIVPPIIILMGTIGNLLTLIIMITDRNMRSMSTYFYLAVLAVADTVVLYLGLLTQWVSYNWQLDWHFK